MSANLGLCQWFHYEDFAAVEQCVGLLEELGATRLRTGISWADFHRPHGRQWYDWQMHALQGLDVLLSVWHTPPSIAEGHHCAGPPERLADYADFLAYLIDLYGDGFETVELWNEPNNRYKWDFRRHDPCWSKFGEMIRLAAAAVKRLGKCTVLGGIIPVDPAWLTLMRDCGALDDIDVLAIHGFPGMWGEDDICWEWKGCWHGWQEKVAKIAPLGDGRPVWITETGLSTWDMERKQLGCEELQVQMLLDAQAAPAERVYWYSLMDLAPERAAIEGFHVDEYEYHMGLARHDGTKKPAFDAMKTLLRAAP